MRTNKTTLTLATLAAFAASLPLAFAAEPAPKKESTLEKVGETIKKDAEAVGKKTEQAAEATKDTVESQVDKTLGKPLPFQTTVASVDAEKKLFTSKTKAGK